MTPPLHMLQTPSKRMIGLSSSRKYSLPGTSDTEADEEDDAGAAATLPSSASFAFVLLRLDGAMLLANLGLAPLPAPRRSKGRVALTLVTSPGALLDLHDDDDAMPNTKSDAARAALSTSIFLGDGKV